MGKLQNWPATTKTNQLLNPSEWILTTSWLFIILHWSLLQWWADVIPVFSLEAESSTVTPAGVSGISPLYSLCSCCPRFLAVDVEVGAGLVWARQVVLVRISQSDCYGWRLQMLGGSSAQSPRCRLEELLPLESPASDAWTKPPGLPTHWCLNGHLEGGPAVWEQNNWMNK